MTDQVIDIFAFPAILILLALFVLGLAFLFIFISHNANDNQMNVQCTRFADAMNAYVSSNAGFSDQGAGSFANFVSEYVKARQPNSPVLVVIKAWNTTGQGGSTYSLNESSIYNATPSYCSAFWVARGITDDYGYNYYKNRLSNAYGSGSSITSLGQRGVMQEGWLYSIELYPFYKVLKDTDEATVNITINDNAPVSLNTLTSKSDKIFTFNGNDKGVANKYYLGGTIVCKGIITNYTKNAKSTGI